MSETKDMSGEVIAMWVFGTIFGLIILVILLWYIRYDKNSVVFIFGTEWPLSTVIFTSKSVE